MERSINSFKDIFQTRMNYNELLDEIIVSIPLRIYFKRNKRRVSKENKNSINSFKDIFQTKS